MKTYLYNDICRYPETKRELYEEFLDHLEQLRRSYVDDGVQDAHAIKLAIADFGESELVGGMINKVVSPNRKWLKALSWFAFTSYALIVVYLLLLTPIRLMQRSMEHPHPNLIPLHTILQYANSFHSFNFDTWFFNLFGNVLLFVPLGFLLPILFKKSAAFPDDYRLVYAGQPRHGTDPERHATRLL